MPIFYSKKECIATIQGLDCFIKSTIHLSFHKIKGMQISINPVKSQKATKHAKVDLPLSIVVLIIDL